MDNYKILFGLFLILIFYLFNKKENYDNILSSDINKQQSSQPKQTNKLDNLYEDIDKFTNDLDTQKNNLTNFKNQLNIETDNLKILFLNKQIEDSNKKIDVLEKQILSLEKYARDINLDNIKLQLLETEDKISKLNTELNKELLLKKNLEESINFQPPN